MVTCFPCFVEYFSFRLSSHAEDFVFESLGFHLVLQRYSVELATQMRESLLESVQHQSKSLLSSMGVMPCCMSRPTPART
mmetsp:Transcript_26177/g.69537  ORF Transcript_26177/g.69537 Transcript_26177/m.69537 type:complete len:80 (+) Transcript_26177:867-1106(+)